MNPSNQNTFPVIQTERLVLRQLEPTDANQIFALRSSPEVNKYLGRKPSENLEEAGKFIEAVNQNVQNQSAYYWGITLKDSDSICGTICLFNFSDDKHKAEIGYELLPPSQGQGIMQEALTAVLQFAFSKLKLEQVEAFTHLENLGSTQLLDKAGFKRTEIVDDHFGVFV